MEIIVRKLFIFLLLCSGCGFVFETYAMQHTLCDGSKKASIYYMECLDEAIASLYDDVVCFESFLRNGNTFFCDASLQKQIDNSFKLYDSIKTRSAQVCEALKIPTKDKETLQNEASLLLGQITSLQKDFKSLINFIEQCESFNSCENECYDDEDVNCTTKSRQVKRKRNRFKLPKNYKQ